MAGVIGKFVLVFALLGGCLVGPLCAQPAKVIYELQERCGRRAAEIFAKEFGQNITNTEGGQVIANYENHYNTRLNKCFIFETSDTLMHENGKSTSIKVLIVADVNANKIYANFDPMQCDVQGQTCHSEQEWRALIKPLMEE